MDLLRIAGRGSETEGTTRWDGDGHAAAAHADGQAGGRGEGRSMEGPSRGTWPGADSHKGETAAGATAAGEEAAGGRARSTEWDTARQHRDGAGGGVGRKGGEGEAKAAGRDGRREDDRRRRQG